MSELFSSLQIRGVTLRNRIGVSPMCMYSAPDGVPQAWHMAHLGSRAVGGAGLVMTEATAVEPIGAISPADAGIWNDKQAAEWTKIAKFVESQGAVPGIQLAHAGRKASRTPPFAGGKRIAEKDGGWIPIAPSAVPYDKGWARPRALDIEDLEVLKREWVSAAARSVKAGFKVIELHYAHGYLMHTFLSPLSNRRKDGYGGNLENRMRYPLEVAAAVRAAITSTMPLFVRISATDWIDGGWDLPDSIEFAKALGKAGVDLVDCSSGGLAPGQVIAPSTGGPKEGYQVPFAAAIRKKAGISTAAVGLITRPKHAESLIKTGKCDLVMLAREMLREPYWPIKAARALGAEPYIPEQYQRAHPRRK